MKNFISKISGVATNPSLCPDLELKTLVIISFFLSQWLCNDAWFNWSTFLLSPKR